jgi:hypothetical protein
MVMVMVMAWPWPCVGYARLRHVQRAMRGPDWASIEFLKAIRGVVD